MRPSVPNEDAANTDQACNSLRWALDPNVTFLNHGSFGACPRPVLEAQTQLRARLERDPVQFFARDYPALVDRTREALGQFIGAAPADLALVSNATSGINAVLRSLRFEPGDELLVTNHGYNACCNAAAFVAERSGAKLVVAQIPFPVSGPEAVLGPVFDCVGPRTRLALIDHVSSATGLVLPIERLVRELEERGVATLVDGAHAPGMLPLDITSLGASYYAGNCHKWVCAPKGAGFLYVRADHRDAIRPPVISHGANAPVGDRSRFHLEFDWTGTHDPTAWLTIPTAIEVMGDLLPGGWQALQQHNRSLALKARTLLCERLGVSPPCPDEMIGSLAALPLPDASTDFDPGPFGCDPLQMTLYQQYHIQIPIFPWPAVPHRLIRISCQIYNRWDDYTRLADALCASLGALCASLPTPHTG
jgi:isopenicillin-N epimerase